MMPVNTGNTAVYVGAASVGGIGLAETFLGMPLHFLALGAFAGLLINGSNKAGALWWQVLVSVLASALVAGAFSGLAVAALVHLLPFGAKVESQLGIAVPVLIGGCWSWAVPLLGDALKRLLDGFVSRLGSGK